MTDVTCWQLTRGRHGWTVSACCQGTRQSSADSGLSSAAGSGPHPRECPEQSSVRSDTEFPFLVFCINRQGGGRETELYRGKTQTNGWSEAPVLVQICDYPTALVHLAQWVSDVVQELVWQNWTKSQNTDKGPSCSAPKTDVDKLWSTDSMWTFKLFILSSWTWWNSLNCDFIIT